jgi:ribosomal protein S18 acetylase RimI-like enzyme
MIDKIRKLDEKRWKDHVLKFHYTTEHYYDVQIARNGGDFSVSFTRKPLAAPYERHPDSYDRLFQHYWDDVVAWGIVEGGELLAALETSAEVWNNRLRVNELWVHDDHRRKGIATALMDLAKERAITEKRRALVLETQSCNANAIEFYLKYGFSLIGFDACAYGNNDLDRGGNPMNEVRMEFGIML